MNIDGKKHTEKTFFIDIPQNIPFKYFKHNVAEKLHGLIFTNDTTCFVVQVNRRKYEDNISWYGSYKELSMQNIPEKFVMIENIKIQKDLYCGYYYYKNYFVYYYNVAYNDIDIFNSALKSIRRKNKK